VKQVVPAGIRRPAGALMPRQPDRILGIPEGRARAALTARARSVGGAWSIAAQSSVAAGGTWLGSTTLLSPG
jgi:hypothetical protein